MGIDLEQVFPTRSDTSKNLRVTRLGEFPKDTPDALIRSYGCHRPLSQRTSFTAIEVQRQSSRPPRASRTHGFPRGKALEPRQ
jgi:hypothetical protein